VREKGILSQSLAPKHLAVFVEMLNLTSERKAISHRRHKASAGIPWISSPFNTSFDKKTLVEVRQNRINQPGGKTVRKPKNKNIRCVIMGIKALVMDY